MTADVEEKRSVEESVSFHGFISYSHAGDGLLAPRLQVALQRFAKPWWQRRAVRVFRDESSLSANPHLWSSISGALDASGWFILLTSPEAAASPWVDREVAYWLEHKSVDRILPVLTDGTFAWDDKAGHLAGSSSVPPSLLGAFAEEPRWVDMRWARGDTQLDLRNSRFRSAVADIASTLRGIPKDDLESEEVHQHRRTLRTAWGAAALLTVLAIATTVAALYANGQRQAADSQRIVAEEQTGIALDNEALAESEAERAVAAESLARSRELAASAINVLDEDPELSILLGLEAIDGAPSGATLPIEAVSALREGVHASKLRQRILVSEEGGPLWTALSPDGSYLAVASEQMATVRLFDTSTMDPVWEYSEPETVDNFSWVTFAPTGDRLALSIVDSTSFHAVPRGIEGDDDVGARLVILDAASGEPLETRALGECPSFRAQGYSPDGRWLAASIGPDASCDDFNVEALWRADLLDAETLETQRSFTASYLADLSWSADSARLAVTPADGAGARVYDVESEEILFEQPDVFLGTLSPDGTRLATIDYSGGFAVDLHDVETGAVVDQLSGLPDQATAIEFTSDSGRVISSSQGDAAIMWDVGTGEPVHTLHGSGQASTVALDEQNESLYLGGEGVLTVWDLSGASQGEINSVSSGLWFQANSMTARGERGAYMAFDLAEGYGGVWAFDAATGEPGAGPELTSMGTAPAVLPDGRIILAGSRGAPGSPDAEQGPALVWNPDDGSKAELVGCWVRFSTLLETNFGESPVTCSEGEEWFPIDRTLVSPDGSRLLVTSPFGKLRYFDAETLEPLDGDELPPGVASVRELGNEWILAAANETNVSGPPEPASVVEIDSGASLLEVATAQTALSRDGSLLAVTPSPGAAAVYDTTSWTQTAEFGIGGSRIRGLEFSPDGSKLMTASTDGFIRIWNTQTGEELARLPLTGASDGHWLNETHIVVGTSDGLWTTLTLDVDELVELARSRLTRDFTAEECSAYQLDACS